MLSHILDIIPASECAFVPLCLFFFVLLLLLLSFFSEKVFGVSCDLLAGLNRAKQTGPHCPLLFFARTTTWCEAEGVKRTGAERVCVCVSPKDVLLLIQKPSIALNPPWFFLCALLQRWSISAPFFFCMGG